MTTKLTWLCWSDEHVAREIARSWPDSAGRKLAMLRPIWHVGRGPLIAADMHDDIVVGVAVVGGRDGVIHGNGVGRARDVGRGATNWNWMLGATDCGVNVRPVKAAELRLVKMNWPLEGRAARARSTARRRLCVTPMPATHEGDLRRVGGGVGRHVDMVRGKLGIAGVGKV